MARYGKEHKQATRRRIVETAGRRLKRDGIDGSGIATLIADAGLTNGAFYAHFESKEDLVANTLAEQLREQRESFRAQRGEVASASVTDVLGRAPDGPERGAGHQRNQVCALSELCALGRAADRAYKSLDSCVAPTRGSTAVRSVGL